ncbi:MAG: DUF6491 family protein [Woeseiaceae bacterium]|nr:DUF6491 family protein [Woeseiaceae bacterium]
MKKPVLILAATLAVGACSTGYDPQEIEAVRDFVSAAELEPVDQIRVRQLSYSYVNDRYVIIKTRKADYLVELRRDCFELRRQDFTYEMVDRRQDTNVLRARFDTIRGCPIGAFYEITDAQRKELKDLGDAPGEEVFIPDEDEK